MHLLAMKAALRRATLFVLLGAAGCTAKSPAREPGPFDAATEPRDGGGARDAAIVIDASKPSAIDAAADAEELAVDASVPTVDSGSELPGPWADIMCDEQDLFAGELNSAMPISYLGYYHRGLIEGDEDGGTPAVVRHREQRLHGFPCSGALDPVSCLDAIDGLVADCESRECAPLLIATAGDAVNVIEDRAELLDVFGPLDTSLEALLVAKLELGAGMRCVQPSVGPAGEDDRYAIRKAEDGYEIESKNNCGHWILSVTSKGSVSIERFPQGLVCDGF